MSDYISDMRASSDGTLFGTSLDHKTIRIWDAGTLAAVATVDPGFSGGSHRFAIDPKSHRLFSGTWEEGLTCYDYAEHRVVWHRADVIGIQQVDYSPAFPSSLFVAVEAEDYRVGEPGIFTGVIEFDVETGREKFRTTKADAVYLHPTKPAFVLCSRGSRMIHVMDGSRKPLGSARMAYFAILDVAFHEDHIAISEGGEGVRLIDLQGKVLASYRPPSRKPNCLDIAFVGGGDELTVFDSWEGSYMTRLDPTGHVIAEYQRESHEDVCFIGDGTRFLDALGRVCQSSDGIVLGTIEA